MTEKKTINEEEGKTTSQAETNENQPADSVDQEKGKKKDQKKHKPDKKDEEIASLNEKLASVNDRHLRLQAEFDNYRKRTLKEKADLIKTAGESVLANILPVIDDFNRALDAMKNLGDDDPIKQGFLLINNKFNDFLKQNNVKEIDALNQVFDCELHEALTKIPAPAEELKGKNIDVIQKGYLLNDKVIRFAKVVVGE
jgi:molecular chaperone GrpE